MYANKEKGEWLVKFAQGNLDQPVGTAIVYWTVRGRNLLAPGHRVIASTVMINVLPLDGNLLTATFPPAPFQTLEDMLTHVEGRVVDIVYGGELDFPKDRRSIKEFTELAIADYNRFVEDYSAAYRQNRQSNAEENDPEQALFALDKIRRQVHNSQVTHENTSPDLPEEEEDHKTKAKPQPKEKEKLRRAQRLVKMLMARSPGYSLAGFVTHLSSSDSFSQVMARLMMQLAIAVHQERYEEAEVLASKIKTLKTLPGSIKKAPKEANF